RGILPMRFLSSSLIIGSEGAAWPCRSPLHTSWVNPHGRRRPSNPAPANSRRARQGHARSEEHTSELQSLAYLVCRLLLEKKVRSQRLDFKLTGVEPAKVYRARIA